MCNPPLPLKTCQTTNEVISYVLGLIKVLSRLVHHRFDLNIFRRIHWHQINRLQQSDPCTSQHSHCWRLQIMLLSLYSWWFWKKNVHTTAAFWNFSVMQQANEMLTTEHLTTCSALIIPLISPTVL